MSEEMGCWIMILLFSFFSFITMTMMIVLFSF